MLGSYGLQTYIWNNRLKSLILLAAVAVAFANWVMVRRKA